MCQTHCGNSLRSGGSPKTPMRQPQSSSSLIFAITCLASLSSCSVTDSARKETCGKSTRDTKPRSFTQAHRNRHVPSITREDIVCNSIETTLRVTTEPRHFLSIAASQPKLGEPDIDSNLLFNVWQWNKSGRWSLPSEIMKAEHVVGWVTSEGDDDFPIYHGVYWNSKGSPERFSVQFTPN